MSLEKSSLMLVVIASNSVVVPLQVRSKSLVPPLSHRLCTDFGTEEERRKNGGETKGYALSERGVLVNDC